MVQEREARGQCAHLCECCRNAVYGVIVLTFVLLLLLAFSGFLVAVTPVYFRWLGQMSYLTFAFAAMLQNELTGSYSKLHLK